ncbi:sulfatase-like hydrolase/transferase [Halorussus marinus]|uniref:sulfatase-like hydrolase/transferase n=1 Tax=Halorussus marinus TaxID=2505976 RepID=UPI00106F0544|nr:sulfatase-like hydrolase/transferase [Halorussus marinus]
MVDNLCDALQALDVENVFVYVGDAVRWDYLPGEIASEGTVVRTVAASIHSPPSFASLATGRYPPSHGVFSFSNRVHSDVPTLFEMDEYQTRFLNSVHEKSGNVDPIYSVLRERPPNVKNPFEDLSSPFVVMERGPGGHAPYDRTFSAADRYFSQNHETNQIRTEYRGAIQEDADKFQRRLTSLEEEGLLDDTLVIYTSDHGELLGEGGAVGHNAPMRPELIWVPTVFVHPSLDTETLHEDIIRHVDVFPTILEVLCVPFEETDFDGVALGRAAPPSIGLSFYRNRVLPENIPFLSGKLAYEGAWDRSGGFVFARTHKAERLAALAGKAAKSPKRHYLRSHPYAVLRSYLEDDVQYGNPSFSKSGAEEVITNASQDSCVRQTVDIGEEAEQHLRDLGYL